MTAAALDKRLVYSLMTYLAPRETSPTVDLLVWLCATYLEDCYALNYSSTYTRLSISHPP